jgi:hypothetical protein
MLKLEVVGGSLQIINGTTKINVIPTNIIGLDSIALYQAVPIVEFYNKNVGKNENLFKDKLSNLTDAVGAPFTVESFIIWASESLGFEPSYSHADLTNVEQAGVGVIQGHISDQTQTIAGKKTFAEDLTSEGALIATGDQDLIATAVYTVLLTDNGRTKILNSATDTTITIDATLLTNFSCSFSNLGAGLVTFVNGTSTGTFPDGTVLVQDSLCTLLVLEGNYRLKGELV